MARVPWVEQAWGQDELARTHRLVGFTSFTLMLGHIVLITLGYAAGTTAGVVGTFVDLVVDYPGHAAGPRRHRGPGHGRGHLGEEGPPAAALRVVAPDPPLRLPRRGPGPAPPAVDRHRLPVLHRPRPSSGGACTPCAPARCSSSASGCRCGARSAHRCGCSTSGPRAPDVTTVTVGGRGVRRMPVRAGQFFQWRFLDGPGWSRGQPLLDLRGPRRPDPAVHRGPPRRRVRPPRDAAPRHPGARRGPLRPAARRGARPPQGAAHGVRHRHHARCAPCSRSWTRPPATSPSCTGSGPGRRPCSPTSSPRSPRPAAPATSSSRAPGCPTAPAGCPPRPATSPTSQALREIVPDVADHDVYLCGSDGWMTAARTAAIEAGVPARRGAPRALLLLTTDPTPATRNPPCAASRPGC